MEKLRELMKEHQDKADKKVMGEVLELLQREPGLFVVTVHATKNFFLGAENGKAAAFLYTSREYADEFVKGLEMVGVETKVLEIRPLQRAFGIFALGYPDEERTQQDRFDQSRIHYVK